MPGTVALELSADSLRFNIRPLVISDGQLGWNKIGPIDPIAEKLTYQPEQGDSKSAFPVMATLTRKIDNKEQRIIVSGDADFMSNRELDRWQTGNSGLLTGIFRWLNDGVFPIDTSRPPAPDNKLRVDKKDISFLSIVFIYVIPSLIGIWAAILLIRRKRK
jgi:ABC-2 type transport system permease protein